MAKTVWFESKFQVMAHYSIGKKNINSHSTLVAYVRCLLEGYQEAAERFQDEADIEPGDDMTTLAERTEIREAIHNGEIENAVMLIDAHFPGMLMSNDELRFQLQAWGQSV